ncbi:hypothetical protein C4K00_3092 [Pseudomonas synxantha]|nr:hypothetical protein C4K00_3092 [Pseudomonas synxantha]
MLNANLKKRRISNVGKGLLPMAVGQHPMYWLIHRYREQAPSHLGSSS